MLRELMKRCEGLKTGADSGRNFDCECTFEDTINKSSCLTVGVFFIVIQVDSMDFEQPVGSRGLLSALMPEMKQLQEDFQKHSKLVASVILLLWIAVFGKMFGPQWEQGCKSAKRIPKKSQRRRLLCTTSC